MNSTCVSSGPFSLSSVSGIAAMHQLNLRMLFHDYGRSNALFISSLYCPLSNTHTYVSFPLVLQFGHFLLNHLSVQFSSVAQSCPTLCDPMNRITPGLPVHHHLPEFTQTHVHRVHDAIQPSHPLLSPSPPAPNPSQHQSLFQ